MTEDKEYIQFREAVKAECEKQFKKTGNVGKFVEGYKAGFRDGYLTAWMELSQIKPEDRPKILEGAEKQWPPKW